MNPAVIIPWRKGEDELQSTIDSAAASIGAGRIMPVEDAQGQGPGRTRDKGIMAADGSDVIVVVDAHMKFRGDVLRKMARRVARFGGLLCAVTHHNEDCAFNTLHPSGHGAYYGADIHWKGEDENGKMALLWKWQEKRLSPGPVACIGGACYVFRRDWYLRCGRPLALLPCWGGDEEVLSMACWLSGQMPHVYDGHVAHRWRKAPPWKGDGNPELTLDVKYRCRAAIISAFAHDRKDAAELLGWQGGETISNEAVARTRAALLKLPRKWADWKAAVPVMDRPVAAPVVNPKPERVEFTFSTDMSGRANYGALENNRMCANCGSAASKIVRIARTGRIIMRDRICMKCGRPRKGRENLPIEWEVAE